ncbi:MAG: AbiH family protein [Enterococcus sp.]|uniref:AbiH family protein n=1 Tax=Enterococcus sp. TaxID=35783 RepID=UPI002FC929BE
MSSIRKLIIIGNGFDLHHGIKSGFADFYNSSFMSEDIKNVYEIMTEQLRSGYSWYDFEEEYRKLIEVESDILGNKGYDGKTLGLTEGNLKIYKPRIDMINYIFQSIFQQFIQYLKSTLHDSKNNPNFRDDSCLQSILDETDQIINFNYTSTLSDIYDVPENKIIFVHGSLKKNNPILGHSNYYDSTTPQNYGFRVIIPDLRTLALLGDKNLQRIEMWNEFKFKSGSFSEEKDINLSPIEKMKIIRNNSPLSIDTIQHLFDKPFSNIVHNSNNQNVKNELAIDFSKELEVFVIGHGLKSDFDLLSKIPVTVKKVTILKRSIDSGEDLLKTAKSLFKTDNIYLKDYEWD